MNGEPVTDSTLANCLASFGREYVVSRHRSPFGFGTRETFAFPGVKSGGIDFRRGEHRLRGFAGCFAGPGFGFVCR